MMIKCEVHKLTLIRREKEEEFMMKMNKACKVALSSLLGLSLLAGCGSSNAREDGEIAVNLASEPPKMTSFLSTDSTSGNVLRHVVEGLTKLDSQDQPIPGIAEKWDVDGNTYTFHLRQDAKWNDGSAVTAHDFEFGWDELFRTSNGAGYASTWAVYVEGAEDVMAATAIKMCPVEASEDDLKDTTRDKDENYVDKDGKTLVANKDKQKLKDGNVVKEACPETDEAKAERLAGIDEAYANKGWKAIDDYTFEVKFTGPYPYIPDLMAFYSFAPISEKLYNEYGGFEKYGKEADAIAYNGPFTITSWKHEDSMVLEKNENYYGKDEIKLTKIQFKMIKDTGAALNGYENGDLDMIGLNGEQAKKYRDEGKEVLNYDDGGNWYFEYNTTKKPFNNAKVRKALMLGIDVQTYIDKVVLNNSKVGQSFTTPSVQNGDFYNKVGQVYDRSTDFTAAKALLEEGLAEEGMTLADFTLNLLGDTGDTGLKSYSFFQEQWKKNLGIPTVNIEQVEFKTRLDRMDTQDFDVVFAGWSLDYNDPMTYLDLWLTDGGNNHGKYSNPEYDALINAAYKEGDVAKREEMLLQAEKIIAEDVPVGVVYYRSRDYVVSSRVKGIQRSAFRDIDLRFAETVADAK